MSTSSEYFDIAAINELVTKKKGVAPFSNLAPAEAQRAAYRAVQKERPELFPPTAAVSGEKRGALKAKVAAINEALTKKKGEAAFSNMAPAEVHHAAYRALRRARPELFTPTATVAGEKGVAQ